MKPEPYDILMDRKAEQLAKVCCMCGHMHRGQCGHEPPVMAALREIRTRELKNREKEVRHRLS